MTLSMYQASVPVFLQGLKNLSAILDKAVAQATERKIDPTVLFNDRLAPDMFPLVRQVQIASDHAKGAPARLAGLEVPKFEDVEKSFDELQQRLARVIEFVNSIEPARIDGSEEREITLPLGGQTRTFNGQTYLLYFALPNFYFHLTTAYAILRHNGIAIGKRDFIGVVP
ncbi:DUF1993 domain-containing protein [Microvirga puerhi]|uniref:DUF1993 family protein n=1 Tax=Microvirga puerhi TaxID=2876078 RepID=A0ABS7VK00_9HYPH|nr:DUF1993 family protein [Microvirga puerhi]MBZ6075293.1 DUF1993 family protein [Microvirga puerhi]